MRNVFLKAKNQRDFENKGYSIMPMLSSREVNWVLSELQLMKPDDNFNPDLPPDQPNYHLTDADTNVEYKRTAKKFIANILASHIEKIFDSYKMIGANFIIKPPGKGSFFVHQDWTFVADPKHYTSLTIWCPLIDVDESNGTLQVVEGSHKIVSNIATSTVDSYCKNIETLIVEKYSKSLSLRAGECVIFDQGLLHHSDVNRTAQSRYVMQAIIVPTEIDPVFYYFDRNSPEKGFEIFQMEPDFFIVQDRSKKPINSKSLGFTENRNKLLTEAEFIEKMRQKDSRFRAKEEPYFDSSILNYELEQNGIVAMSTLVNLLQNRAFQQPDYIAYTFLEDGKNENGSLTYAQLDKQARTIATYLQSRLVVGARVLLVYPQGLEAIAAFFGCLYAGIVAIPAPAPEAARLKRVLPRLEAIAVDAEASLILTTANLLANRGGSNLAFRAESFVRRINGRVSLLLDYYIAEEKVVRESPHLTTLPWIATDNIPVHLEPEGQLPEISGDTLAYLQYTSGSTSTPKGVMLDHNNLLGHLGDLQQAGGYDAYSVTVTWMPYFHDYGLVEGILAPLYNGTPCYLMSPMAFIKQPLSWLKVIDRYRATHSQAPNFAYAYCLKRIASEELTTLDLSSWQAAGNAAEPINSEVMAQFCQFFEPCGFRPQTFAPAYGLAEATLLVTTSRRNDAPVFCTVAVEELAQNRIVETPTGKRLAGSGRLLENTVVAIVHPEKLTRCAADEVGEIWVASAGVARGYWQKSEATAGTFRACLADTGEGMFLRTGDLGFIKDGELFVTGRLKDLIIIRGENYYPQDIEWVVERSHGALRPNAGAAFAIETAGVEQLIIAFEVDRKTNKNLDIDEVIQAIRSAVAEYYELPIYAVVLLKRGSIPKTSSGKIQRQACRQAFLDGSLDSIATWTLERASSQQKVIPQNQIESQLVQIWQRTLGIASISTKDNFFELGGDSLKAAVVAAEVKTLLKQEMSLALLATAPTIEQLAFLLCQENKNVGIRSLVSVKPSGYKRPFFYIHGLLGYNSDANFALARHIDPDRPFYGIQAMGVDPQKSPHTDVDEMASHYIQEIQFIQPEGPYLLGGVSAGGSIAFEVAQKLQKKGQKVQLLVMVDTSNPYLTEHDLGTLGKQVGLQLPSWAKEIDELWQLNHVEHMSKLSKATRRAITNHSPKFYQGRVVYFAAEEQMTEGSYFDPMQPHGWNSLVANGIELQQVPGNHFTMHYEPHVLVLAEKLNDCLKAVS